MQGDLILSDRKAAISSYDRAKALQLGIVFGMLNTFVIIVILKLIERTLP